MITSAFLEALGDDGPAADRAGKMDVWQSAMAQCYACGMRPPPGDQFSQGTS
jgi:hypothetical protein